MRLLGAKEFLKTVKPGTLCIEFWQKSEEECLRLIKDYETGSTIYQLLEKYGGEFYVFGDNSGSLSFLYSNDDEDEVEINGFKYDCLFYYDKNIVGDASPRTTLQLVFENEDEWPEKIYPEDYCDESINKILNKEDIKRIIKWFLEDCGPFRNETSEAAWALKSLEKEKNNVIINYKGGLIMKDKNNLEPSDYKTSVSNTLNQETMHEIDEDLQKAIDKELYKNADPTGIYIDNKLSPLEALHNLYARASVHCPIDEISIILDELCTIETALKEKANIENRLDKIFENHNIKTFTELNERLCDYNELKFDVDIKEKSLKALEIIKEKAIDIFQLRIAIMLNNLDEYNKRHAEWCKLTQEEYDLLKEVLK